MGSRPFRLVLVAAVGVAAMSSASAQELPGFDFTRAGDVARWQATHDVSALRATPEGMQIEISGGDPYVTGPPRDFPAGQLLWMRIRIRADEAGTAQLFYFRGSASEEHSVRFPIRGGVWEERRLPLPALGPGYRFRIDPPGARGGAVVAFLTFAPRVLVPEPDWPTPVPPRLGDDALSLSSGDLTLRHAPRELGGFAVEVAGRRMAVGLTRPLIGTLQDGRPQWLALAERAEVTASREREAVVVRAVARDDAGATWEIRQRFAPVRSPGAVDVETRVTVDRDREVLFLPMLTLLPGVGSFGTAKGQGLFAGLEYLENEPSSSEADLEGPAARRQVPDSLKITFPLMAIQAQERYVGLIWDRSLPQFAAVFDSPDRLFRSGGHVMGVLFPGSDGSNRVEGRLLPYDAGRLPAGQPLLLRATLIGGRGESVVPAVERYVALRGLSPVLSGGDLQKYAWQTAAGWLETEIREDHRYRHAFWPGTTWNSGPAPDAAVLMEWLAGVTPDGGLAARLRAAAKGTIALVPPAERDTAGVSHLRPPAPSLLYGAVLANVQHARQVGRSLLGRFEPDGSVLYRKAPDRPDFGRTHSERHANGLTAEVVARVLEMAARSGDPELIREGLRRLRQMERYRNGVPRGAQTWEIALHTPDILASAHLVRAYTLGYELTGEETFREQARYWAWTGVPFLYLTPPPPASGGYPAGEEPRGSEHIGLYASIAVLGATHWKAPVWMGLPVQWCGLVYADALYRFARHDPDGPWKQLADGITASGIRQSWPLADGRYHGLLPDSFDLRVQARNPVAINPGTVQVPATRLFGRPLHDFRAFRRAAGAGRTPWLLHAPGAIEEAQEEPGRVRFTVHGWPDGSYHLLVAGLTVPPRVRIDGRETPLAAPHEYRRADGLLILRLTGTPAIELRAP
jgi:hypothetical protein